MRWGGVGMGLGWGGPRYLGRRVLGFMPQCGGQVRVYSDGDCRWHGYEFNCSMRKSSHNMHKIFHNAPI